MNLSSNAQLRLFVAITAFIIFLVAIPLNREAATFLTFPLIFAVIIAPQMRDVCKKSSMEVIVISALFLISGLLSSLGTGNLNSLFLIAVGLFIPPAMQINVQQLEFAVAGQVKSSFASAKEKIAKPRTNTQRRRDQLLAKQAAKAAKGKK